MAGDALMAKIEFAGLDEYMGKIRALGLGVEGFIKQAVYPAAGMVIEEIKRSTPVSDGGGDLRDSEILIKFQNDAGYIYTQIVFDGYDRNGVPNALKANALESGTSKMQKQPFIRPAVNRIKGAAQIEIERQFNEIINKKMEG